MTRKPSKLFVYGTLQRGFGNHLVIQEGIASTFLHTASLTGTMVSLGGFPGYLPEGETEIKGEVYHIDDPQVWRGLDGLEGYREENPEGSFYRLEKALTTAEEEVFVYVWNGRGSYPIVDSGDWRDRG